MIYDHFHKSEQPFVDRVLDWKREVVEYGGSVLTPFLDQREQQIVYSIMGESTENYIEKDGGFNIYERARLFMAPAYIPFSKSFMEIEACSIQFPSKFATVTHRDVLGTLMGLGLKREKFGDIHIGENSVQFVLTKDVASYVTLQLERVGRTKVKVDFISLEELWVLKEDWIEKSGTVSSLRLDVLLAEMFRINRQKAALLIEGTKVKCNWRLVESPSHVCTAGDVFSVRGMGRATLLHIEGMTKKDKIRIKYGVLQ